MALPVERPMIALDIDSVKTKIPEETKVSLKILGESTG
jgi:hypothetical protein